MQPSQFNLLIPQGTNWALTLQLTEGPGFRTTGASAGATKIPLSAPLPTALSSGDRVNFDGAIATLTAAAAVGAKSLTVPALPFELGRVQGRKVLDVTGFSTTARIYADLDEAAIATVTVDLTTAPSDGRPILKLTKAETSALASTVEPGLFLTEAELQAVKEQGPHYLWQFDLTDTTANTLRLVEGFVLVSRQGAA